jgi:hypothetical protein
VIAFRDSWLRIVLGFLIAPILPCSLLVTADTIEYRGTTAGYLDLLVSGIVGCYILTVLFALPIFLVLHKRGLVNFKTAVATGVGIGSALGALSFVLMLTVAMGILGAAIAAIFWLAALRRNSLIYPKTAEISSAVFE